MDQHPQSNPEGVVLKEVRQAGVGVGVAVAVAVAVVTVVVAADVAALLLFLWAMSALSVLAELPAPHVAPVLLLLVACTQ